MLNKTGLMVVIMCLALLLAACQNEDAPAPSVEGASAHNRNQSSQASAVDSPTATPDARPALPEGMDGMLALVQGSTLYLQSPYDSSATLVASEIDRERIILSPDSHRLLYNTLASEDFTTSLYQLDIAQATGTHLADFELTRGVSISQWSPDGEWIIVNNAGRGPVLMKLDASQQRFELNIQRSSTFWWLSNGRIAWVEENVGAINTGVHYNSVGIFDPATNETKLLEIDFDALPAEPEAQADNLAQFRAWVEQEGGEIVESSNQTRYFVQSQQDSGPLACRRWDVLRNTANGVEIVLDREDVYALSEVSPLTPQTFMFLEWKHDNCRLGTATVSLMQYTVGQEPQLLTSAVYPDFSPGLNSNSLGGQPIRYSVSPDGLYVVWIGGGIEAGYSTLNLYDLQAGENIELVRQTKSTTDGNFVDHEMYSAVFWIS